MLVESRILVLKAANRLPEHADLSFLSTASEAYYRRALADQSHVAMLVFEEDLLIGTGGISFFSVMPTCGNPSGEKAYLMNIYTHPDYRCQGIASKTVTRLIQIAKQRGISQISLEATDAGRALYQSLGFVPAEHEMELKILE